MSVRTTGSKCLRTSLIQDKTALYLSKRNLQSSAPSGVEKTHTADCDVTIVGGGPVGLALATVLGSCSVAKKALRVVLIEAGDLSKVRNWDPSENSFSNRVSSLTNASQSFLTDIGAWPEVQLERTCPVEEMQVWDGISDARIKFKASEMEIEPSNLSGQMARLTENLNLQRALLRRLQNTTSHIELLDNVKVGKILRDEKNGGAWPLVHLSDGQILRTRLLVGADGFGSPVRAFAGIPSFGWSYDRQAIVATMNHPARSPFEPPNTTAYQRFLLTGPIAFLPVSATASSLVWSTKPELASALVAAKPGVLPSMVNAAFRLPDVSMRYLNNLILDAHKQGTPITLPKIKDEILWRERSHTIDPNSAYASATVVPSSGIPPADSELLPPLVQSVQTGTVASFPLRYNHTESYVGEDGTRAVLVGDAAHTVHPLAGQGLNLGLADVECLARCIRKAILAGGDIGSYTSLLPYAQERYLENHILMSALDKLHKLYSTDFGPIVWARSVGVEVINELDSVKTAIMSSAGAKKNLDARTLGWNAVVKGVQGINGSLKVAGMISQGVSGALARGFKNIIESRPQSREGLR